MKTAKQSIVFTKADVWTYCEAIGEHHPLYDNEQYAKDAGLVTMPLPPTMPVIVYKLLTIPWAKTGVMIHRKQRCIIYERMFINRKYTAYASVTDAVVKKGYTFQTETLFIHNERGELCFESMSDLVYGDAP